jgi:hypothetical protein
MKLLIITGALIRIEGDVSDFLKWCMTARIYGYSIGGTGPSGHTGFYDVNDVPRIEEWARNNGCTITKP